MRVSGNVGIDPTHHRSSGVMLLSFGAGAADYPPHCINRIIHNTSTNTRLHYPQRHVSYNNPLQYCFTLLSAYNTHSTIGRAAHLFRH